MSVEPIDHPADLGLSIEAPSLEELYARAAAAFTEIVTDGATVAPVRTLEVRLEARDRELLLVEWLDELVFLFDTEALLVKRTDVRLGDAGAGMALRATLYGETFDPERHPFKVAVKGVTYHGLEVRRRGDRWRARVIFDI